MPEEVKPVNPKGVKGVSTVGESSMTTPNYEPYYQYIKPTTDKEKFLSGTTGSIATGTTDATVKTSGLVDARLTSLYTPINLAKAIPDQFEREKYLAEHGSKMVQLLDPNKYGIKFDRDALDYSIFKAKNYDIQLKKFLDDLDENQGFLAALGNTSAKLVGKTATAVGGLIPLIYGIGSSLINWDSKKLFDNTLFDAWETADHYLDKKFAVYGGVDYLKGDKNFFARFADNPMKSINADIIPAAAFVAGAVLTEFVAGAVAATSFGAGSGILVANTARLAAQATNLFSKGVRVARGLDTLSDFNNMRKIVDLTQKIRTGIGTATTMVRTAGYESSLIARDTQRRTQLEGKLNYIQSNPALQAEAQILAEQGYTEEEIAEQLASKIDPSVLSRINHVADQAGELAWFTNIPLVGFSNIIQFGKSLNFSYRLGNTLSKTSRLNPLRGTFVNEAQEMVTRASVATRGQKILGYGMTAAKQGVTEAFEEFSQGVIEQGYSDYYASQFKSSNIQNTVSFIDSMTKATRNYWNSTEGKDSITIGALMGMLGIPLPISIDSKTGKGKLGMQWYGGVYGEIKELREGIKQDQVIADLRNKSRIDPVLKNNFENAIKNMDIQDGIDESIKNQDVFTFKNKEFEQYHTFVNTRYKNGVADTIYQDLDALDKMDLKTFNDQYAFEGFEFTAETKKEAINKTRKQTQEIIASHKEIETLFNDSQLAVDKIFNKKYRDAEGRLQLAFDQTDKNEIDLLTAQSYMDVLQDELVYLHSTNKNLSKREKELKDQISELTKSGFNTSLSNKIVATPAGTKETKNDIKIEYATSAKEMYKAQLAALKESDPILYDLIEAQLKPLVQDLIKINDARAKNASLYNTLFTKKGAKDFLKLHADYSEKKSKEIVEALLKKREDELAKAKSSSTSRKVTMDEEALRGTNNIVSQKTEEEAQALSETLSRITSEDPESSTTDFSELLAKTDGNTVLEELEKSPALFIQLLKYLENQGTPLVGITDVDQLTDAVAQDPSLLGTITNALAAMLNQFKQATVAPPVTLEYADPTDQNDTTPSSNPSLADLYKGKLEELNALSIFQPGFNVSDQAIIPLLNDKKITAGEVERDEVSGKFKSWYYVNDKGEVEVSDQPVDLTLINSPDFLNNEELKSKVVNATFKIADNEYNKTERSAENVAIDIYHGDVFIGRLPAFQEGMPSHLLALRQAVVAQEMAIEINNQTTTNQSEIDKLNAEIEKLEKEKQEELNWENKINNAKNKEDLLKIIEDISGRTSSDMSMGFNASIPVASQLSDAKRFAIQDLKDIEKFFLKGISNKYDAQIAQKQAELKALESTPQQTVEPIIPNLITVKVDLKPLSITELKTVVTQLKQKEVNAKTALKQGKQVLITPKQYEQDRLAVKAYIESLEKTNNEIIEKRFKDIAIQLANSKDERFFNKNNEFKKCN